MHLLVNVCHRSRVLSDTVEKGGRTFEGMVKQSGFIQGKRQAEGKFGKGSQFQ